MVKKESKPWGIWVLSLEKWMMDSPTRKSRFKLRREAVKEADEINRAWKGRKHDYEARKI
jgi:hypothetical protein